jgi:hypothetical protein
MSTPDPQPTANVEKTTPGPSDAARRQQVRHEAVALRAESRQARQQSAEIRGETNAILDAVVLLATGLLRRHRFALRAPVAARFRMSEHGSTGVEITVHLEDPTHAEAARVALLERFPDPLSDVIVS